MHIVKRDGSVEPFDKEKIVRAIHKAMDSPSGVWVTGQAEKIACDIEDWFKHDKTEPTVTQVERDVFFHLVNEGNVVTAKAYEAYRAIHEYQRKENTSDKNILNLIHGTDEDLRDENSNKSSSVLSTQRDLIAGEVSKDIAYRKLLPEDLVEADKNCAIHIHDLDYIMQPMTNCFSRDTKFVTDRGILAFSDCYDGMEVDVLDKDGNWQPATVHQFGKQKMKKIVLTSGRTQKTFRVTDNHKWLLKDGSFTDHIKVGDRLWLLPPIADDWEVKTRRDAEMFCLGFMIGDGSSYISGLRGRLCEHKTEYAHVFKKAGYAVTNYGDTGDLFVRNKNRLNKELFLAAKGWKYLGRRDKASLFHGLYCADGAVNSHKLSSANDSVIEMITEISACAGYHIASRKDEIRSGGYKENASLTTFSFILSQPDNRNWIVKEFSDFTSSDHPDLEREAWCVTQEVNHTFTLEGGVVTGNCCLVNLKDMLDNGTVINKCMVETPKSFQTACTITTQIIAQVASNQYGGQAINGIDRILAPYVRKSYERNLDFLSEHTETDERKLSIDYVPTKDEDFEPSQELKNLAWDLTKREIRDGVQTIQYQLNTLQTTNGQSPFVTLCMYFKPDYEYAKEAAMIDEEILKQRIEGVKNEQGVYITPAFPKLIYVLDEHNIHPDSPYYYLTKLAAECTAKRMYPDYISAKVIRETHGGHVYTPMGCRSFLSLWQDKDGNYKFDGRFNQGVVSLNLPQIALIAKGDKKKFDILLQKRLELVRKALMFRHNQLKGNVSDIAPILWQNGAYARLQPGEKIDKYLEKGYSTLSLGYIGLYEACLLMTGESNTTTKGHRWSLLTLKKLRDAADTWKAETGLGFSVYGSPAESLCYKFAKKDREIFGSVQGVTDKGWYTNSYHVTPTEHIDWDKKWELEAPFQQISSGGAISYVEVPNMTHNVEAVLTMMDFLYNHIQYAEFNTKLDYCHKCGYSGEIKVNKDGDWECPNCGNKDRNYLTVVRRTCGYLGSNFWNKGKTKEISSRVTHI